MKNWRQTTLGELVQEDSANYQTGPFGTVLKASEYSAEGVPLISVGEIREGYIQIHKSTPRVCEKITARLSKYVLEEQDIVFGRKGAINRNAIIQKEQAGWFLGSDGIRLRLSDKHSSSFFSYQLRTSSIKEWLMNNGKGAIMPSLNQKILDRLPISLPDLTDQQKIAKVLSTLDAKIEVNNKINAELEAMAKLLYDYWFVQFDFPMTAEQAAALGNPALQGKPYKSSGGPMTHNQTLNREIPEGWTSGTMDQLGEVIGGSTPSKDKEAYFSQAGIPWITPKDLSMNKGKKYIQRGAIDVSEAGKKATSLKLMPKGTVLLSSRAPIGYTAIASNTVTTNQGFKSFVPNRGYSSDYIYQTLNHYMKLIEQNASGSTFREISGSTLKTIKIPFPPNELEIAYSEKVVSISKQQENLEHQNQELTTLRDWLLPMLMNGQVTVK